MSSYQVAVSQDAVGSTMIGGVQKYTCMHTCMTTYTYTYTCIYAKTPTMECGEERQIYTEADSVQSFSHVRLFATPWTAVLQASLFITNSQSLPKLMSIESVMPSNHLILCCPLLLLPSIFPSIRVFSNESVLRFRWPKYWSFSFNTSPSSDIQDWFPLGWTCKIMQV